MGDCIPLIFVISITQLSLDRCSNNWLPFLLLYSLIGIFFAILPMVKCSLSLLSLLIEYFWHLPWCQKWYSQENFSSMWTCLISFPPTTGSSLFSDLSWFLFWGLQSSTDEQRKSGKEGTNINKEVYLGLVWHILICKTSIKLFNYLISIQSTRICMLQRRGKITYRRHLHQCEVGLTFWVHLLPQSSW